MHKISIDHHASDEDKRTIRSGIIAYNDNILGEKSKSFSIFLKDAEGNICGGLLAWYHSLSLYIDVIWVAEKLRYRGFGTELLTAAENEARRLGCRFSTLDTYSFQAEIFYLKNAYVRLGEIKQYSFDHSKIFLRKNL